MLRVVSFAAILAVGATAVFAQSAAIKDRKELFKQIGGGAKVGGPMMKGEVPFDLAKVQGALKVYSDNAKKLKDLFPDDSKTGGDTEALPAIWEKKADFLGMMDKFDKDSAAASAAIKDEASFKTEWPKVMANCGGCHKVYKVAPKS
jgi:cytochrome c556